MLCRGLERLCYRHSRVVRSTCLSIITMYNYVISRSKVRRIMCFCFKMICFWWEMIYFCVGMICFCLKMICFCLYLFDMQNGSSGDSEESPGPDHVIVREIPKEPGPDHAYPVWKWYVSCSKNYICLFGNYMFLFENDMFLIGNIYFCSEMICFCLKMICFW